MNNTSKILILGIVIAMAVAGVLMFYSTIVTPPTEAEVNELYGPSLENDINKLDISECDSINELTYEAILDKIAIYKNDTLLSDAQIDLYTKDFIKQYVPVFTEACTHKFKDSVWLEEDHAKMLERIEFLRSIRVDNGINRAITYTSDEQLYGVEEVISLYNEAKDYANADYSTFYSVSTANEQIG